MVPFVIHFLVKMNSKSDMLQLTVLVSGGDAIGKLFF